MGTYRYRSLGSSHVLAILIGFARSTSVVSFGLFGCWYFQPIASEMHGLGGEGEVDSCGVESLEDLHVHLFAELEEVPISGRVIPVDAEEV